MSVSAGLLSQCPRLAAPASTSAVLRRSVKARRSSARRRPSADSCGSAAQVTLVMRRHSALSNLSGCLAILQQLHTFTLPSTTQYYSVLLSTTQYFQVLLTLVNVYYLCLA